MTVKPWTERWPGRLEWELAQLEAAGMRHVAHEPDEHGIVRIDVVHTVEGMDYELEAYFPQLYPYFRPEVRSKANFDFHQEPFGNGLCLVARDPGLWSPEDSLAAFLARQLPLIVAANAPDADRADDVEEQVPEPIRENYNYPDGDFVLVDSAWMIPGDVEHGTLDVGVIAAELPMRAAVLAVRGPDDKVLAQVDGRLRNLFKTYIFQARWTRVSEPIVQQTGPEYLAALESLRPNSARRGPWRDLGRHHIDLVGVLYPDEIRYADYGDDWVFLLRVRQRRSSNRAVAPTAAHLIRALRSGTQDMAARVPQLRGLRDKKVAVFGLGALGAPAATALARSGIGRLSLIDKDFVDPATTPRWPQGIVASGMRKVQAVGAFVAQNYPYTAVELAAWRLGDTGNDEVNDVVILNHVLADTDLILDATANTAANHALADAAWELGIPYVCVSATAGAWGGIVACIERGRTACWSCFNAALDATIPLPPADDSPTGRITPVACSETTFTGAGFDLTPLSDEAVRSVVSRLSADVVGGYPAMSWSVEVLALRSPDGEPIPPSWSAFPLRPQPDCPYGMCNAA